MFHRRTCTYFSHESYPTKYYVINDNMIPRLHIRMKYMSVVLELSVILYD